MQWFLSSCKQIHKLLFLCCAFDRVAIEMKCKMRNINKYIKAIPSFIVFHACLDKCWCFRGSSSHLLPFKPQAGYVYINDLSAHLSPKKKKLKNINVECFWSIFWYSWRDLHHVISLTGLEWLKSAGWLLLVVYMSLFTLTPQGRIQIPCTTTDGQRKPHCADITLILIGAIKSAINQYFKIRAGPSGVVRESLGNHYHGLCITSISQVSVNNLSFKNW